MTPALEQDFGSDKAAQMEVWRKVAALTAGTTQIDLKSGGHVLANVASLKNGRELVLYVLNYDSTPARNVRIRLKLGPRFEWLAGWHLALASTDRNASRLQDEHWTGRTLEAILPSLNIYSAITITARKPSSQGSSY